ncbi:MAG: hypothetical protein GWM98_02735, partial [Nitrospinaceae bacterium]|nr:DUF1631 domain-containing protein [Nitrospinaceae bacterium]NIY13864.1 hypothetical protein [Nitrospinaceae bacterium]
MEEIIIDRPYFGDLDEEQDEGAADTPDPEDPMLARVRALPLGCWLEFRRPDGHVY